jgi:hypothetical protein
MKYVLQLSILLAAFGISNSRRRHGSPALDRYSRKLDELRKSDPIVLRKPAFASVANVLPG